MYFIQELKRKIINKKFIIIILICLIIIVMSFLIKKSHYFFELTNYITRYLDYYTNNYLNSAKDLIFNEKIWIFVEYDVINIYSATFIYFMTQDTFLFALLSFVVPVLIFFLVSSYIFDELYSKFYKNVINKIGIKRYVLSRLTTSAFIGGLFAVGPKLLYLLLLKLFFINSYSNTHYIYNNALVPHKYAIFQNNFTPNILLISDLLVTFLYGVIVALVAVIIISLYERKVLSYLIFIFVLLGQAILASILQNNLKLNTFTPLINMYSISDFLFFNALNVTKSFLFLQYGVLLIITALMTIFFYNKRVKALL